MSTRRPNPDGAVPATASISADRIALGTGIGLYGRSYVLARNQEASGGWGRIAAFSTVATTDDSPFPPRGPAILSALSGDTLLLAPPPAESVEVYVSDTDRDGVRDGIDPCPRDPLNNKGQRCRRDLASSISVASRLAAANITTTFDNPLAVTVSARYINSGTTPIRSPFLAVTSITNGAVLIDGDGGAAGALATISPDVGDGVLSPGESTDVMLHFRLTTPNSFVVHLEPMAAADGPLPTSIGRLHSLASDFNAP